MISCYLALGSNLHNPSRQIIKAIQKIKNIPKTILIKKSSLYLTHALSYNVQPHHINASLHIKTFLPAEILLKYCQEIENQMQRKRTKRYDPRTIDIDLLTYGQINYKSIRLTLPHPRMLDRDFVLVPLQEIAPSLNSKTSKNIYVKRKLFL